MYTPLGAATSIDEISDSPEPYDCGFDIRDAFLHSEPFSESKKPKYRAAEELPTSDTTSAYMVRTRADCRAADSRVDAAQTARSDNVTAVPQSPADDEGTWESADDNVPGRKPHDALLGPRTPVKPRESLLEHRRNGHGIRHPECINCPAGKLQATPTPFKRSTDTTPPHSAGFRFAGDMKGPLRPDLLGTVVCGACGNGHQDGLHRRIT